MVKKKEIDVVLRKALSIEFRDRIGKVVNPYEGERTSDRMIGVTSRALRNGIEVKKSFLIL